MSDQLIGGVVTVATAIIGVAIIAVLVGSNAQTSRVIASAGSAFSGALQAAEAPVLGGSSFGGVQLGNFGF
jgi:PRD1 phage membrane DNA delivery